MAKGRMDEEAEVEAAVRDNTAKDAGSVRSISSPPLSHATAERVRASCKPNTARGWPAKSGRFAGGNPL